MKVKYYEKLSELNIFYRIEKDEIPNFLLSLYPTVREIKKGEYIYIEGDRDVKMSIVLSGGVELVKNDYWGREFLLAKLGDYEVFGETYALMSNMPIEVDVRTNKDSIILQIDISSRRVIDEKWLKQWNTLKENLLQIFAMKNYYLSKRLDVISQRRTRDKVLTYLLQEKRQKEKSTFTIPLNRQQLADYLCVDRSALSIELGKMQDEGIIKYEKNKFTLFQ